jgi:hypothetical protein
MAHSSGIDYTYRGIALYLFFISALENAMNWKSYFVTAASLSAYVATMTYIARSLFQ